MSGIINRDMRRVLGNPLPLKLDEWVAPSKASDYPGPKCPECGIKPFRVDMPAGDYSANMRCACGFDGVVHFSVSPPNPNTTEQKVKTDGR